MTGIDISAPYVRYGRARAEYRDSRNTKFYLMNAQVLQPGPHPWQSPSHSPPTLLTAASPPPAAEHERHP